MPKLLGGGDGKILHSLNIGSVGQIFAGPFSLVQASPLISVIAVIWLIRHIIFYLRLPLSGKAFQFWFIIGIWLGAVTSYNIIFAGNISVFSFSRQLLSLLVGLGTFLFLVSYIDDARRALVLILRGFVFIFPFLVLVWLLKQELRLSGFYHEPSHFAQFVSLIVAPGVFLLRSVKERILAISVVIIALFLSFSITGIAQFCALLSFISLQRFSVAQLRALCVGLICFAALFAVYYTFSSVFFDFKAVEYLQRNAALFFSLDAFEAGLERSHSLADRFYSFYLPIANLVDYRAWIGYGLGSDIAIYRELLAGRPGAHFWDGTTSGISSFWGKVLVTFGAPAALLFFIIYVFLFWRVPRDLKPGALVTLISGFYSMGAFSNVFIWFWLAIMISGSGFVRSSSLRCSSGDR